MCVSCSWAKPADYHQFEFCENGAKATLWELTTRRFTPDFFAKHTVTELRNWNDYDLEQEGRLTDPLRYDSATDKYVPCEWDEAFAAIGAELKALDPKSVVFYSSGRASLERPTCTGCSRGYMATTTCPIRRTCATRRRRWRSRRS